MSFQNIGNTFVVKIRSQKNNTWQGTIEWIETKKSIPFRSALELMRLMDSAIGDNNVLEDWDEVPE